MSNGLSRRERNRISYWRQTYGLTPAEVEEMFVKQSGRCAMVSCRRPLSLQIGAHPADAANIDHCHDTGRVRGLLCSTCNTGLGRYERHKADCEIYLAPILITIEHVERLLGVN